MGLRDGDQLFIEHAGEAKQIITLVLQRDAHCANAARIVGLAARQFFDDEVKQHLARGQRRAGKRQNVMAQPLRERPHVAGEASRPGLDLPRKIQMDSTFIVSDTLAYAVDSGLQLLAA
jgi:hypothetical protein